MTGQNDDVAGPCCVAIGGIQVYCVERVGQLDCCTVLAGKGCPNAEYIDETAVGATEAAKETAV